MKNLESKFASYQHSLALKELGFREKCLGWYLPEIVEKGNISSVTLGACLSDWTKFGDRLSAPLKSQVFEFFRDNYGYDVTIKKITKDTYQFLIELLFVEDINYNFVDYYFDSYNEAESKCIDKLLEIVNRK